MHKRHVALIFLTGAVAGAYLHSWLMPTPKWQVAPGEPTARSGVAAPALREISSQEAPSHHSNLANLAERRPTVSALAAVEGLAPIAPQGQDEHSAALTLTLDEGLINSIWPRCELNPPLPRPRPKRPAGTPAGFYIRQHTFIFLTVSV